MKNKGLLETVCVRTEEMVVHNVNKAHKNGLLVLVKPLKACIIIIIVHTMTHKIDWNAFIGYQYKACL